MRQTGRHSGFLVDVSGKTVGMKFLMYVIWDVYNGIHKCMKENKDDN